MAQTDAKVLAANLPVLLTEKVEQFAQHLERSPGSIIKQALAAPIDQEEERDRLTRLALADVDENAVIDHQTVQD
ncbi:MULTISPECIES: CopG family ribbon-helix-helix protein [unclassified Endozoicomonas]|uniref:CopG family ribbon-helix-helix protein n=1 Tax=unclassified Endozoicomonas TaxID=2644528 RepID=UPI003BB6FAB6